MTDVLRSLITSKKFLSMLVGILVLVGVRYLGLEEAAATELSREIVAIVVTLIAGQGLADLGKEHATREAQGVLSAIVTQGAIQSGFTDDEEEEDAI